MERLNDEVGTFGRTGSRIEKRVGSIFIHVSDMKRSVEWYSHVLELPFNDDYLEKRLSTVYSLPVDGTEILLDSNHGASPGPQPLMFFKSDDIQQSLQFLKENDIVIHHEALEHNIIIIEDPDGNKLMLIEM
ncbi:VOC family protein [Paenibacillus sp. PR3]|uniref:VOC family protein n=1 Tax=Paenibacillus terricola TaxID=2763503 RepID=A0ABR8MQW8_9BACL|nr:VOC family protein [Paenibacillus terricola]MBD3918384.1 VOC family protein [Paenibacillus terricola]